MLIYDALYRRLFSRLDAESAHRMGFAGLRAGAAVPGLLRLAGARPPSPDVAVEAFGLRFPGPLGVAAGFDKNAVGIDALAGLGFGFVEVGTVTAEPQPGNPRPRMVRLPADRALVNRMGFNNSGARIVARRLAARQERPRHRNVIVGVNIAKTKVVPDREAVDDYRASARLLAPYADYLVVNVSSPNTPGLRDLQAADRLAPLLSAVRDEAAAAAGDREVPVLVKIAPDLADDDVLAVADVVRRTGAAGVVAVNTTVRRTGLASPPAVVAAAGAGGLSGPPLRERALAVLALLRRHDPDLPVISVGGVTTAADVSERLAAGAVLVQAYTGFVYGGPAWPSRVQRR